MSTYTHVAFDIHVFGFYPEGDASEYGHMLLFNNTKVATKALRASVQWFYERLFFYGTTYTVEELDALCPSIRKAIHDNELVRANEEILWTVKEPSWNLASCEEITTEEGHIGHELKGTAWCMIGVPAGVDEITFRQEFHRAFTHHTNEWGIFDDLDSVTSIDPSRAKL